jgi:hypothetical protein
MNRDEAIESAENLPSSEDGLYKDLRVSFYNSLDYGKVCLEDPCATLLVTNEGSFEYWGSSTADDQTPWLNC